MNIIRKKERKLYAKAYNLDLLCVDIISKSI